MEGWGCAVRGRDAAAEGKPPPARSSCHQRDGQGPRSSAAPCPVAEDRGLRRSFLAPPRIAAPDAEVVSLSACSRTTEPLSTEVPRGSRSLRRRWDGIPTLATPVRRRARRRSERDWRRDLSRGRCRGWAEGVGRGRLWRVRRRRFCLTTHRAWGRCRCLGGTEFRSAPCWTGCVSKVPRSAVAESSRQRTWSMSGGSVRKVGVIRRSPIDSA